MFEIIGLIFATAVFFVFSGVVAIGYGGAAWLILRRSGRKTPKLPLVVAFCLPVLCAGYLFVFEVGWTTFVPSAHESLFGDIDEPLPNGYVLSGLAKMPDYCHVDNPSRPFAQGPPGDIGRIAVEGPILFTSTSRSFGEPDRAGSERGFHQFDTRTQVGRQFETQVQMESAVGHHINLVPAAQFRSSDLATLRVRKLGRILQFAPAVGTLLLYLLYMLRLRRSREIEFA